MCVYVWVSIIPKLGLIINDSFLTISHLYCSLLNNFMYIFCLLFDMYIENVCRLSLWVWRMSPPEDVEVLCLLIYSIISFLFISSSPHYQHVSQNMNSHTNPILEHIQNKSPCLKFYVIVTHFSLPPWLYLIFVMVVFDNG